MKRFTLAALPIVAAFIAMPATASQPNLRFAAQGELVAAHQVELEMKFRCTEWPPLEFIQEIFVRTSETVARTMVNVNEIVCDGRWHTYLVRPATDSPTPLTEGVAEVSLGVHSERIRLVDRVPG